MCAPKTDDYVHRPCNNFVKHGLVYAALRKTLISAHICKKTARVSALGAGPTQILEVVELSNPSTILSFRASQVPHLTHLTSTSSTDRRICGAMADKNTSIRSALLDAVPLLNASERKRVSEILDVASKRREAGGRPSDEISNEGPSKLSFFCDYLCNLWNYDRMLEIAAFGPLGIGDVLERAGYTALGKLGTDIGNAGLAQRALLRFPVWLLQLQGLRSAPQDTLLEAARKERRSLVASSEGAGRAEAAAALESNGKTFKYLETVRWIYRMQARVNLVFQPLDSFGWISRASSGFLSGETTTLLDRGASLMWLLVESLELWKTILTYRQQRRLEREGLVDVDKSLLTRTQTRVLCRLCNMAMAYNWARKTQYMGNSWIGLCGVTQSVLQLFVDLKAKWRQARRRS